MKKKVLITLMAFCIMVLCNLIFSNQNAKAYSVNDSATGITWYFEISNGEARNLRVYSYYSGETLTIPSTVTYSGTTYPVTSIGTTAYNQYGIYYNSSYASYKNYVKKIIIPEGIKQIGCVMINATGLETIELPETVEEIGVYAFYNCSNLATVNFPSNLKKIGDYSFYKAAKLTSLNLPNTLEKIGNYAFWQNGISGNLVLPTNVEEIGNYAFQNCTGLTGITFNVNLKKIGNYAFSNDSSLTGNIVFSENLESIGNSAFQYCSSIKGVSFPESLKKIGTNAFYCNYALEGNLIFPSNLERIDNYAFYYCQNLTGNLTIPDSVTYLGSDAFEYCSKLNGVLNVGSGVKDINGYTFRGTKFNRVNLGEVRSIGYKAFEDYTDLWIDNEEENVTLNSSGVSGEKKYPYIHYRNDTHNVEISSLPGIKLINQTTGEELTSGDYACESNFNFKLQIEAGYNYSNLSVIIVDDNDTAHYKSYEGNAETEYAFESLIRDRKIYVQNLSNNPDFSLRMFITEVNRNLVSRTRVPTFKMENGEFKYLHTKSPVSVKTGDLVTYKIRVYNESSTSADPGKVAVHIPDGLEFVTDNRTNTNAGWVYNNGVAITSKLEGSNILANVGNGVAKYKDVEIVLKVTADKGDNTDIYRTAFAEIYQNSTDSDSTPGNISITNTTDYRTNELFESDNNSYLRCGEDDEDFDTIYLRGKIKVDYNIVINKIDGETKQLLDGAKFNLLDKDGNVISTVESDQDGIVDFGGLSTYGSGTDIYYIQEIQTPLGYYLTDNKKIRVKVEKTILNEDNGLYSLKVTCDTLAYTIDTTRYDFTPIYTPEQFRKIGSGELVEIDGVKYQYNIDTNYKIMNDIDFSAEGVNPNWTPIDHEMKCIIDGDGHKIKGLRITGNKLDSSEIGIFSVFSGIIENLELEDIVISFNGYVDEPLNISGKTGVGSFAGVMREGYVINCKTSGVISTGVDNVGGFIGHTLKDGIVRFDGCTNNIEIHGQYQFNPNSWNPVGNDNIGGLVGCSLGSISVNNSINNGQITNCRYNAGGLVGFVDPSEYQDLSINTAYDEDNKILNLLVENITTEADYTVHLQDIDIDTEEALLGGIYTVYDGGKNVLDGMKNMELDEIMKKIVERQLRAVGLDTYYIIEEQPVPGYEPINGIVRLDVERYWDDEEKAYKFRISASVISDIKYEIAEPNLRTERPIFDRGDIFTDVKIEQANMNTEKAEFIACTNNGEIVGNYMNGAGIVATAHGYTYIENCKNTGHINLQGYGKAGGIISELYAFKEDVVIKDCENTGNIEAGKQGSTSPAGGIAANVVADITLTNCKNSAQIVATGEGGSAGILGDARGYITIDSCENTGFIVATTGRSGTDQYSVDSIAAGIFAKNGSKFWCDYVQTTSREDNIVKMVNCKNTGDVFSSNHIGGMIAYTDALYVEIKECEVSNCYLHDIAGDKGGMVGLLTVPNVVISNCVMDNVDARRTSNLTNNTYGCTGAMVGNWCSYGDLGCTLENLVISNCSATNSMLHTWGQNVGGMLGIEISYSGKGNAIFTDCYVGDCTVINDRAVSTYGAAGGIFGNTYGAGNVVIRNCVVERTPVTARVGSTDYGGDIDAGGIFGMGQSLKTMTVTGCDVIDSTVTCISQRKISTYTGWNGQTSTSYSGDGCAAAGGIVAEVGTDIDSCTIDDCNVINTNVNTNSGTVGGIIGHSGVTSGDYSNPEDFHSRVLNTTFKGGTIENTSLATSASITSGILGYCSNRAFFENCLVEDAKINSYMSYRACGTNTTGILGMNQNNSKFVNCDVRNTDILCTGAYGSSTNDGLANVTGIVGHSNSGLECIDCDVDNCKFTGYQAANIAGISGCDCSNQTNIDNCTVTNCEMLSYTDAASRGSTCTMAGLAAVMGKGSITNSKVEGVTFTTASACNGGLVAVSTASSENDAVILKNNTVRDLTINDTGHNWYSNSYESRFFQRTVGGIAGTINCAVEIENITVDDIDITSQASTVAGGLAYGKYINEFADVSISNVTIENNPITNGYDLTVAGAIGDVYQVNASSIKNVTVSDSSLTSKCNNVSGFLGTVSSDVVLDNIKVNNVDIENTNESSAGAGEVGGLVSNASGTLTVNNSEVKNSSVKNSVPEESSVGPRYTGGIVGYAHDTIINNSSVTNTNVSNPTYGFTGGFVGMIHRYTDYQTGISTENTLDVTNSNYTNGSITGYSHTGGIAGMANETIMDNVEVNKATIISTGSGTGTGGLVGLIPTSDKALNVYNSRVINGTTVTGKQHTAGMIGCGKIDATNNTLSNLTVTISDPNPGAIIGGMVGVSQYGSSIDGVTANNITIIPNSCHSGGLAGVMNGNISNVNIDTVKVEMEDGFGEVGGVAAIVNGGTLNNITVDKATIKGRSTGSSNGEAGAVVGVVCGGLVNNATVTNSTISSNKEAGGIAGVIGGNLTNSTVDNVTVTVSGVGIDPTYGTFYGGDCGGAVGACGGTIENVTVTNSTITNAQKLAAGIVGAGNTATVLKDLFVDTNTVTYGADEMTDGTYIGAPKLLVTFSDPNVSGNMIIDDIEEIENEEQLNTSEDTSKPEEVKEDKELVQDTTSDSKDEEVADKEIVVEESEEKTDIITDENEIKDDKEDESDKEEITEEKEVESSKLEEPTISDIDSKEEDETSNIEAGDKPEKENEEVSQAESTNDSLETTEPEVNASEIKENENSQDSEE